MPALLAFGRARIGELQAAGIACARIIFDPGIGFGKTREHNLALLADCIQLHEIGCPVMVGHSRKSFLAHPGGNSAADRLAGTIAVACALVAQGVQILRVHDVAAVRQSLELFKATGGLAAEL